MDIKEMIGARIKEFRTKRGLTQDQLAERMNVSPKYLSSIERGRENPTLNILIKLSEALDVELAAIFTLVQVEDTAKRKPMIHSLVEEADSDQLKLIYKVLSAIVH